MTTVASLADAQKKQYLRFVEEAADRALAEVGLDEDGIQKLVENGDEFRADIVALIQRRSVPNQFDEEEVESNYGYLSGYQPIDITEQLDILGKLFSGMGSADEKTAGQPLPRGAEGWFAIPKWETVAPTYGEAVQKVLNVIKESRGGKFSNQWEGQLGPQYLRQSVKSANALQKLADEERDRGVLTIAAQFGLCHAGRSVRRARATMSASEFGLGAFATGIMLLTHPERLQHYDDLWIDCAGDEFSYAGDGRFGSAPYFDFAGRVRFDTHGSSHARDDTGSASAFVSQ